MHKIASAHLKMADTGPHAPRDNAISPIYNEWLLRRAAPYLGGIESKLLTLNKIARILYDNQLPGLERTGFREWVHYTNLTKKLI